MKPFTALLLGVFLGLGIPATALATMTVPWDDDQLTMVRAEFGIYQMTQKGEHFIPTKTVPLIEGQNYGWRIFLKTKAPLVHVREAFTLPTPPVTWGELSADQTISEDKRISTVEHDVAPYQGVIFNGWSVAKGDPSGHHTIRVIINHRYETVFEFEVQPPLP
ncbi:MAG: hypothetical protein WA080_01885 [Sulfuricurvum sp.]